MSVEATTNRFTNELRRLQRSSCDQCSVCRRPFQAKQLGKFGYMPDAIYAGYSMEGKPLVVGDCCKSQLAETVSRYPWIKRQIDVPNGNTEIWRYMDFAKFVALLKDTQLHFSRADLLGDDYEGATGSVANKGMYDEQMLASIRVMLRIPGPSGSKPSLTDLELEEEAQRHLRKWNDSRIKYRQRMYVSCWHESAGESEALWRLYCPPPSAGVAIRTTCARLNASLGDDPRIEIGRVRYIDFQKEFADLYDTIFYKRRSLRHEAEVRAVIRSDTEEAVRGQFHPIDVQQLIVAVVVSPFAHSWFAAVLKETMTKFGIKATVASSEILLQPFY